jgi:hypothetical protein
MREVTVELGYRQTLGSFFDAEKIHSANLYQMSSYLMNAPAAGGFEAPGMLIYPKVDRVLREQYEILPKDLGSHRQPRLIHRNGRLGKEPRLRCTNVTA